MADDIFAVRRLVNQTRDMIDTAINHTRANTSTGDNVQRWFKGMVTWVSASLHSSRIAKQHIDDATSSLQMLISQAQTSGGAHDQLLETMNHLEAAATDVETLISNWLNIQARLEEILPLLNQNDTMHPTNLLHLANTKLSQWNARL